MISKLDSHNDEINTMRTNTRNTLNKFEMKQVAAENRIRENEDEHKRKAKEIQRLMENVLANNERVIKI